MPRQHNFHCSLRSIAAISTIFAFLFQLQAHDHGERAIVFPDIPGYKTLKCDFHQHTVFSDGDVWPSIRVEEAVRDGLDAIALTEHLEYQPHRADIPHPDRNRAYQLALSAAKEKDLVIVNGSEITRRMPPGHSNAIFISDANALLIPDSVEVFREAKRQGAFVFWNHPNWLGQSTTGIVTITPVHAYLLKEKLLDGIEVVNDVTYSDEALQIALDYDLTIMGTSDIHGLIDWQYDVPEGGHRPITLVFAKEKSADAIKEALFARRTAVWFNETLIGREEFVVPLIMQSLKVRSAAYAGKSSVLEVVIENVSDAPFLIKNSSEYQFHTTADVITLTPHAKTTVQLKTGQRLSALSLPFTVLNAVTAPRTSATVNLEIMVQTK